MSIDLSKITYGAIIQHSVGDGIAVSKVNYGIIIDTINAYTPPPRRGFMNFLP